LNSPLSAEGDIGSFTYSGDGTYLVYSARDAPGVAATPFIVDVSGAVPSEPTPINTDPLQQPYVMGCVGHTVLHSQSILMSSEAEIYASTVSSGVPVEPVLVSSDGGEGTAGGVLSPDKRSLIYCRIPEAGPATV